MKVIISRHWHKPNIEASLTDNSISLECPLEDFVKAVLGEMKPAWKIWTRKQRDAAVNEAVASAQLKIQEVSSQAII